MIDFAEYSLVTRLSDRLDKDRGNTISCKELQAVLPNGGHHIKENVQMSEAIHGLTSLPDDVSHQLSSELVSSG